MQIKKVPHPYLKRAVAFIIDWYVSTFFAAIPVFVLQSINQRDLVILNRVDTLSFPQAIAATIMALIIYTLYFCVIPLNRKDRNGQTFGRRLLKLDLIKTDGTELSFKDLFIRDFIGVLLLQGNITTVNIYLMSIIQTLTAVDIIAYYQSFYFIVLAISFVLLLIKKQTLHDIMSRTRMIAVETPSTL